MRPVIPFPNRLPCVECGAWVQRHAWHCPDCGLHQPWRSRNWPQWRKALVGALAGGLAGAGYGVGAFFGTSVGAVLGAILGASIGAILGAKAGTSAENADSVWGRAMGRVTGLAYGLVGGGCVGVGILWVFSELVLVVLRLDMGLARVAIGAVLGIVGLGVSGVAGWRIGRTVGRYASQSAERWCQSDLRSRENWRNQESTLQKRLQQIRQDLEQACRQQQHLQRRRTEVQQQGFPTEHLDYGLQAWQLYRVAREQEAECLRSGLQALALKRWWNRRYAFVVDAPMGRDFDESREEALQQYLDEGWKWLAQAPPELQEKWQTRIAWVEQFRDGWLVRLATDNLSRVRPLKEDPQRNLVERLREELDLEDPPQIWIGEWGDLEEECQRLAGELEAIEEVESVTGP